MSRKQYSKELKLELVKKHLEDGISYWKLGKEYGMEASIIRRWGHKYETFGEDGLEKQNADLCNYSAEFKKKIVLEYLGGNITSQDLAAKYKIHAPSTVCTWIKQYNNHEDLTNSRNSDNDNLNERIADTITKIHDEHPDMGYRRIRDTLAHDYKIAVNDKRVLRICRKKKIQSYIKHRYNCCTKPASDPAYVAENILNREFKSDRINQKWVTDVSEFKYGVGEDDKKGKLYLSVILDLCDRRPVAFVYSTRNDTSLVFDTFDKAVAANPGATPLLHSDRGYQYTSKAFRRRILAAGMTQSMSRVARCIDNGPMEGFWGLMKREMYYGKSIKQKKN